jgi:hypothetical protein
MKNSTLIISLVIALAILASLLYRSAAQAHYVENYREPSQAERAQQAEQDGRDLAQHIYQEEQKEAARRAAYEAELKRLKNSL